MFLRVQGLWITAQPVIAGPILRPPQTPHFAPNGHHTVTEGSRADGLVDAGQRDG